MTKKNEPTTQVDTTASASDADKPNAYLKELTLSMVDSISCANAALNYSMAAASELIAAMIESERIKCLALPEEVAGKIDEDSLIVFDVFDESLTRKERNAVFLEAAQLAVVDKYSEPIVIISNPVLATFMAKLMNEGLFDFDKLMLIAKDQVTSDDILTARA